MGATAQVDEIDVPVEGDVLTGRHLARLDALDDLGLEGMIGEHGERIGPG